MESTPWKGKLDEFYGGRYVFDGDAVPARLPTVPSSSTSRFLTPTCAWGSAQTLCELSTAGATRHFSRHAPSTSTCSAIAMGILDRLRGGGASNRQDAAPSTSGREPSEILSVDENLQPAEAPDVYGGIPDVSNIPPGSVLGSLPSPPGSSQRLYNPYEGLESALDRRLSKSTYSLPDQPEFLFDEEATVHRRNWSENITYYTGTGYLGGESLVAPSHMSAVPEIPHHALPILAHADLASQ